MAEQPSRIQRFFRTLGQPVVVAFIAMLLTLPSLRVGWLLDDQYHRLVLARRDALPEWGRSPGDLFRFLDGNPERTWRLMDKGFVPWWTYSKLRAAFWRPVSVLTHQLDYRLWPDRPTLMHVHSVLWYGLLAAAAAVLYRRLMGATWIAGLAALLYAIDDAHGLPVGWLANRNAVVATFFGVLAIVAHDAWRRHNKRWAIVGGPLLLGVSVLSAEAGIGTCAYLLAYALFLDHGLWRRRLASLLPYAAVIVAWRVAWSLQGYGADGLGLYTDPLHDPLTFLGNLLRLAPVLLLGQWALPPADITILLRPAGLRALWVAAVVVLVGLAVLLWPTVRRDRVARFWACGMLLAVVPIAATFPSDRLLFFVGLGAMGLLSAFVACVFERPRRWGWLVPAAILAVIHLVIAPVGLVLRSAYPAGPKKGVQALFVRTPLDEHVADQDLVIVNAPSVAHALYLPVVRTLENQPVPRRTWILAPAIPSVSVTRLNDRTLRVRPASGYLAFTFDTLFRNQRYPMSVGQQVHLTGLTVEVTALTADLRPAEALFRFNRPLEDASLRWLAYQDGEFVPYTPPANGQTAELHANWPWSQ